MAASKWILGLATVLSWWAAIGGVLAPAGQAGATVSTGPGGAPGSTAWLETGRTPPAAGSGRAGRAMGDRGGVGPVLVWLELVTRAGMFAAACGLGGPLVRRVAGVRGVRVTRGPPAA
ncbi:MAG: hypothetical protein LAT64_06425 [Phycisphaerales bacterium]|nr:hypothetical protein [Planctomycetota bacterium]MCH8508391.1 hypothetical protein [Phycisphaerales bacterium]